MTANEIKSLIQRLPLDKNHPNNFLHTILNALADSGGGGVTNPFIDADSMEFSEYFGDFTITHMGGLPGQGWYNTMIDPNNSSNYYLEYLINSEGSMYGLSGTSLFPTTQRSIQANDTLSFINQDSTKVLLRASDLLAGSLGDVRVNTSNILFEVTDLITGSTYNQFYPGNSSTTIADITYDFQQIISTTHDLHSHGIDNFSNSKQYSHIVDINTHTDITAMNDSNTFYEDRCSPTSSIRSIDDTLNGFISTVSLDIVNGAQMKFDDTANNLFSFVKVDNTGSSLGKYDSTSINEVVIGTDFTDGVKMKTVTLDTLLTNPIESYVHANWNEVIMGVSHLTNSASFVVKAYNSIGNPGFEINGLPVYASLLAATTAGLTSGEMFLEGHYICAVP